MKILNILAQKPHSTGSGVYLTELVKAFDKLDCKQVVVAGIYKDDQVAFPPNVKFCPIYYKTDELPFAIPGMTDQMPYESTVYSQMTEEMIISFKDVFLTKLKSIIDDFKPDLILCNHLYLLTALVRDNFPTHKVACICHGTDLRQIKKNPLENNFIKNNIRNLDIIFALHEEQKEDIAITYGVDKHKIEVIGSGYNNSIFYDMKLNKDTNHINLIYAGKINQKKGVMNLVKSLENLPYEKDKLTLKLAGGNGNKEEYNMLLDLINHCKYPVKLLGKLNQQELAYEFNSSDIFILPSFFEGLPLVLIEALACGLKVISTDLPGIKDWMNKNVPNNNITYIKLPTLINTDEPKIEELPLFEQNIANAIISCVEKKYDNKLSLSDISWDGVCKRIISLIN